MSEGRLKSIETAELRIAYIEYGATDGWPVILSHGFPYDVHAFADVATTLSRAGARVMTPYTRGFGPTRFLSATAMRNGQQAARGRDLLQFADALALERPILGGFDWGANASCVAVALWPQRFAGLVSYAGYDIIDIASQSQPAPPALEWTCWYQHLFQSERGRQCLAQNRRDLCRLLWRDWSPGWEFDEETFARSAEAFENPDFVDVVIHCYRHLFGNEAGDPELQAFEDLLAQKPVIAIPTVTLDGTADPLKPGGTASHAGMFTGAYEHRVIDAGHNLPQQAPGAFADAVLTVLSLSSGSGRRRP